MNDKTTIGSRNKRVGNSYERECVIKLKELGFPHLCTTRMESKSRDDQKIDIMNKNEKSNGIFPYNIQCKNMATGVSYNTILKEMPKGEDNVILHKYTKKVGKRFIKQGEYAIMDLKLFYKLIEKVNGGKSNKK